LVGAPIDIPTPPSCSYCDNLAGIEPPHGPPAVIAQDQLT